MRDRYNTIFSAIQSNPNLAATIDQQMKNIQDGRIGNNYAEFVVVRQTPSGPVAYLIYFVRSEDGIWRVDGM
jgi:hypothetical protein